MNEKLKKEIIVVRSLTTSDMGLFAVHRPQTPSKQRALNINAKAAQILLSEEIVTKEEASLACKIILGDLVQPTSRRHIGKVGKNWRLGGKKIVGEQFSLLDSRDFALIRSVENNDGTHPITILFVARSLDSFNHARIVRLVEFTMKDSIEIYRQGSGGFENLSLLFPKLNSEESSTPNRAFVNSGKKVNIPPIPKNNLQAIVRNRTIKEKLNSPDILAQMLKMSGDLSAPAQSDFIKTIEDLAEQLRDILLHCNRIISLKKDHINTWNKVAGKQIAFVDGGLANLTMLGSAPIAARVGGYIVRPGDYSENREEFVMIKKLINELYDSAPNGVYSHAFPDPAPLRDAARIAIEAAGAVNLLHSHSGIEYLFLHGALVNPVSRYTDIMRDGRILCRFPNFSMGSMSDLLPGATNTRSGRESNFISVYLSQLIALQSSTASVCGVIERESTTSSVIKSILQSLDNEMIEPVLSMPPDVWKSWFLRIVNPIEELESYGQRITDSLLFRCVLQPGEAILPVPVDRNDLHRAPDAWKDLIIKYPKPFVSFLQVNEWSPPIRLEVFENNLIRFPETANLLFHCSLLLPQYSFPVGLDIVDKFAHIPNWMSRPINTNTVVQALKSALHRGDEKLFDTFRRMLCGSSREWFLRPGMLR